MTPHTTNPQHGFSLVDLIMTLAVAGALLGVGVPSFTTLVSKARISDEVNELLSHILLARSEAIKTGSDVVVCPSDNGDSCHVEPTWHLGYIVFTDANGNRAHDGQEPVVRYHQGDESAPVTITSSTARRLIRFRNDGSAGGSNITITFCDASHQVSPRALIISNVGRPRLSREAPDGGELSCG